MLRSVATKYNCETCDYKCCNKTNFSKHILTRRHLNRYTELHKNCEKLPSKYTCSCGRKYAYRQGLYAHKKTCISNNIDNTLTTTTIITTETNNTNIINNDAINNAINNDITSFKYIYLIEKFDVNNKEYIYKFGKTNREYSKRLKEHGDEAKVLLILDVDNCNVIEKKILNILSNTENIRKCSFGNEYFLCNDKEYIKSIILKNIYN